MKFDIKKIGIIFCLLVMMMTMMIPVAFADTLSLDEMLPEKLQDLPTEHFKTKHYMITKSPTAGTYAFYQFTESPAGCIWYDINNTRLGKCSQNGSIDYCCYFGTTDSVWSLSNTSSITSSYDVFCDMGHTQVIYSTFDIYDSKGNLYFEGQGFKPDPSVKQVLSDAGSFTASLFSIATSTVTWIMATPIALIVCVLFLFGCGIILFRKLIKGA